MKMVKLKIIVFVNYIQQSFKNFIQILKWILKHGDKIDSNEDSEYENDHDNMEEVLRALILKQEEFEICIKSLK